MTNFFQNLPIPKELRDALNAETSTEDGSGGGSRTVRRLVDSDGVVGTGELAGVLLFSVLEEDYGNTVWLEDIGTSVYKLLQLPLGAAIGTTVRVINMPSPSGTLGEATVYVGNFDGNVLVTYLGQAEGPFMELVTGNGCTFTRIGNVVLEEVTYEMWEAVSDYNPTTFGGGDGGEEGHALTHHPNGSDPLYLYNFDPVAPIGFEGFSSSNYLIGAAGECAGHAGGFNATVICRLLDVPTDGLQTIFGNWNPYAGTGGWFIGVDNDRWKFGVADTSDGQIIESAYVAGPADLDHFRGGRLHSWHVITLTLYGATAYLVVDGEIVAQINPSSGFQPAPSGQSPYIGRSANGGAPTPASSVSVAYWQYGEYGVDGWENRAPYQLVYNHLSTRQQRVADMAASIGDSKYIVASNNDISDENDSRSNFTRTGGIYTTSFPNVW